MSFHAPVLPAAFPTAITLSCLFNDLTPLTYLTLFGHVSRITLHASTTHLKMIPPASDFHDYPIRRGANHFDSRPISHCPLAFLDLLDIRCRHMNRSSCIRWYLNLPVELVRRPMPLAHNQAVRRVVAASHKLQVLDRLRVHNDVLEARMRRIGFDSCQTFIKPDDQISNQHHVVT